MNAETTLSAAATLQRPECFLRREEGRLGTSRPHTITQSDVNKFADLTHDHQSIHVDPEAARKAGLGGTIVHGFLLLALLPVIIDETVRIVHVGTRLNYGLDHVRFPTPVRTGVQVFGYTDLIAAERRGEAVHVQIRVTIAADNAGKPCCVADQRLYYLSG